MIKLLCNTIKNRVFITLLVFIVIGLVINKINSIEENNISEISSIAFPNNNEYINKMELKKLKLSYINIDNIKEVGDIIEKFEKILNIHIPYSTDSDQANILLIHSPNDVDFLFEHFKSLMTNRYNYTIKSTTIDTMKNNIDNIKRKSEVTCFTMRIRNPETIDTIPLEPYDYLLIYLGMNEKENQEISDCIQKELASSLFGLSDRSLQTIHGSTRESYFSDIEVKTMEIISSKFIKNGMNKKDFKSAITKNKLLD